MHRIFLVLIVSLCNFSIYAQGGRFSQDVQYNIIIESSKDSVIDLSYEVLFDNPDTDIESYVTASRDSFLMVLMKDLSAQPIDTSQLLLYIHGMWGGRRINFNKAYKLMQNVYLDDDQSDIARIISLKWPGNNQEYKENKKRLYSISDQITDVISGFMSDLKSAKLESNLNRVEVDVLAHSLGTELLKEFVIRIDSSKMGEPYFDQMIVAAPDWDTDVFDLDSAMVRLPNLSNRTHVYYSDKDMTLSISKNLNKQSRFGLDGPKENYIKADNVFYINVSSIRDDDNFPDRLTGHNYYRASPVVTKDILMTLIGNQQSNFPARKKIDSLENTFRVIPEVK